MRIAGKVQRLPRPPAAIDILRRYQALKIVDGIEREPVDGARLRKPTTLGEFGEGKVDIPLDERGTRRSAATQGRPTIENEDALAQAGKAMSDKRAGNAGAYDDD